MIKKLFFLSLVCASLNAMLKTENEYPFYNVQELETLFGKTPRDLQKILSHSLHRAYGWIPLPDGCCYIIEKNVAFNHHQMHRAHPWRLIQKRNKLMLQFDDPSTHRLQNVMTIPSNEHQIPCDRFKVIGPNTEGYAVINNTLLNLNDPQEKLPLPVVTRKEERIGCIHPCKPVCASYDIDGNITIYSWIKKRVIYTQKIGSHSTEELENKKPRCIFLNFNHENHVAIVDDQSLKIVNYEDNSVVASMHTTKFMNELDLHTQNMGIYFCNAFWCPVVNSLLLISYRIFGPENPPFIGELTGDLRTHYALYDIRSKMFKHIELTRSRREPKLVWNKAIESLQCRNIHICAQYAHIENPPSLELNLISIKTPENMLSTLKAWFDLHKKNGSDHDAK